MAMNFKCPSCGASLQDEGSFCKYCGARLPEDVKRIRIENVAEMTRAETERSLGERQATIEEREMSLKERQAAAENRRRRAKWMVPLIVTVIGFILIAIDTYPLNLVSGVAPVGMLLVIVVMVYEIFNLFRKLGK